MSSFIAECLRDLPTGLSLHYPILHAIAHAMRPARTLEFGAGGSTRVLTDATGGWLHTSISTEARASIADRYGIADGARWRHHEVADSIDAYLEITGPFDIVMHDGSHSHDVVARDIEWAWPMLKTFGLLLVHDTQWSYKGHEVRSGLADGLARAGASYSGTTLPFGFGLTIVRKESGGAEPVTPRAAKRGCPDTTELTAFLD